MDSEVNGKNQSGGQLGSFVSSLSIQTCITKLGKFGAKIPLSRRVGEALSASTALHQKLRFGESRDLGYRRLPEAFER